MVVGGSFRRMPEAEQTLEFITRINAALEQAGSLHLMTEKTVESWWSQAVQLKGDSPSYWLLLVRIAEAALLCAGNYADNCEYEAAGDFLVTPREILVHRRSDGHSEAKNRHGRLSRQFGFEGAELHNSLKRFSAGMDVEITKPRCSRTWHGYSGSPAAYPGFSFSGLRSFNAGLQIPWHFWRRGAFSIRLNFGGGWRHHHPAKEPLQNHTCAVSMGLFSTGSGQICGEASRSRMAAVSFWPGFIRVETG